MWEKLKGNKTYLVALAAGILTALNQMGAIDPVFYDQAMLWLGLGGVATFRHGMNKGGKDA